MLATHAKHGISLTDQLGHNSAVKHSRAMFFGIQHIGRTQAKRVERTVRHFHRANQSRVDIRLK
ncbi:Uncharacterised protein [Vibrio cholerae]|nr:Uncharacterised protein [Vibrio cholerae]